jgi:hypothetical protein
LLPLVNLEWRFCKKLNCSSAERLDDLQGRLWIRLWLQQLKGNPLRIRSLRELLAKEAPLPASCATDNHVIQQIAELLARGQLHLHARKAEARVLGGTQVEEQGVPFPISQHQPRSAQSPPGVIDPPTFPPQADLPAQVAALVAAAAEGMPLCLECRKVNSAAVAA